MKMKFTLLALLSIISIMSYSQVRYFRGTFSGSNEVPPTPSIAIGTVIVRYDVSTNQLQLWGDYQNLSAPAVASHIHNAPPGSLGPIIIGVNNTGDSTGALATYGDLTASQETELLAGNMYVNVHTSNYPDGEIRAQLIQSTLNESELFTSKLLGAQEVPPNNSKATGSVAVLLDKATGEVNVTGRFSGLEAPATGSHIHKAPAGELGPIIVSLTFAGQTSGSITGTDTLSPADVASMDSGNMYINVHSTTYPAGEIRGQLFNKQELLFFKGELSGSNEVPPTTSDATGVVIVKYDSVSNELELHGDYQNLSAPATGAHIHQAAPGSTGPILIPLNFAGDSTGSLNVYATLTDSQEVELMEGNMYVNVHSTQNPAGEIRTQLSSATPHFTDYFTGDLQASQEVPPTGSSASGEVYALLDKVTDSVFITGYYYQLSGPPKAAHLHKGGVGQNGPVILTLNVHGVDTGTVSGTSVFDTSKGYAMIRGFTYVNVHTDQYPDGEIRAQLADILLPVKLLYFNAYKEKDKIALVWASAQEVNFSHYEIEQQNPISKQWIKKASIAGTNSETGSEYKYSDLPNLYSNNNYVYYRLKLVDKDGKYAYSSVIRVNYNQIKALLQVRPNPVTGNQLQFTITGLASDIKISYNIIDYNGRKMLSGNSSSLLTNTINISSIPHGMYKLVVTFNNNTLQQSFIK